MQTSSATLCAGETNMPCLYSGYCQYFVCVFALPRTKAVYHAMCSCHYVTCSERRSCCLKLLLGSNCALSRVIVKCILHVIHLYDRFRLKKIISFVALMWCYFEAVSWFLVCGCMRLRVGISCFCFAELFNFPHLRG